MPRRYRCDKPETDPTYSEEWSGVTGAPYCREGCRCPNCGQRTHAEGGSHYCHRCDDYVASDRECYEARFSGR